MTMVSLTGRPWHELDRALIENRGKSGIDRPCAYPGLHRYAPAEIRFSHNIKCI